MTQPLAQFGEQLVVKDVTELGAHMRGGSHLKTRTQQDWQSQAPAFPHPSGENQSECHQQCINPFSLVYLT